MKQDRADFEFFSVYEDTSQNDPAYFNHIEEAPMLYLLKLSCYHKIFRIFSIETNSKIKIFVHYVEY